MLSCVDDGAYKRTLPIGKSILSWTEEQAKADTRARDRRALQQLALNVHVKLSDLI